MRHRASRYNSVQPWGVEALPASFALFLGARGYAPLDDDKASPHFAESVETWQRAHGLKPDGMLGPRTLSSMRAAQGPTASDGQACILSHGRTFPLVGWECQWYEGAPFKARKERHHPVTQICLHESVTNDPDIFEEDDTTERILRRKGYGVHFMVGPDGSIVQHNDCAEMPAHAGKLNRQSIGVEFISPYYRAKDPWWPMVVDASWAHKKRYAILPPDQCEAGYQLVKALVESDAHEIPWRHEGAKEGDIRPSAFPRLRPFVLGRTVFKASQMRQPGIWAHGHTGKHADGFFPALYVWLRDAWGLDGPRAYLEAVAWAKR